VGVCYLGAKRKRKPRTANRPRFSDSKPLPLYLRCKHAAAVFGLDEKRIRKLIHRGQLGYFQYEPGTTSPMQVNRLELERWLESHTIRKGEKK
jgi:hypothetical protein